MSNQDLLGWVPRENTFNAAEVTGANDLIVTGSVPNRQDTGCFCDSLNLPGFLPCVSLEQGWHGPSSVSFLSVSLAQALLPKKYAQ